MNSYFILNNNINNDDDDISNSSSSSSDSNKGRRILVLTKEQDLLRSYVTSWGPCNKVVAPLVKSCGLTGLRGLQIGKQCTRLYLNWLLHKLVSLLAFTHFNYYRL